MSYDIQLQCLAHVLSYRLVMVVTQEPSFLVLVLGFYYHQPLLQGGGRLWQALANVAIDALHYQGCQVIYHYLNKKIRFQVVRLRPSLEIKKTQQILGFLTFKIIGYFSHLIDL